MRKNKLAKIATVILAGAATIAIGLTAGCKKDDKHNWDKEWDYDKTYHWHNCLDCDEKKGEAKHVDADKNGKCDVCKTTVPITDPGHTHSYTKWVNTDANEHWKICEADGEIDESTRGTHDYANGNCVCGKADPNSTTPPDPGDTTTKTTTVYFHKPSDWEGTWIGVHAYYHDEDKDADVDAIKGFGVSEVPKMTVDSGDWYKVDVKLPKDTANFSIILFDENDTNDAQIRQSAYVSTGANVYINAKGNVFTTKAAAEADENAAELTLTIHYHGDITNKVHAYYYTAPNSTVNLTTWSGDSSDTRPSFVTDTENEGWSVVTIPNVIASLFDDYQNYTLMICDRPSVDNEHTYISFVSAAEIWLDSNCGMHDNKADAEDADDPDAQVQVTVHIQAVAGWDELAAHFYYHDKPISTVEPDGWPGVQLTEADADTAMGAGWYVITINLVKSIYKEGYQVIVNDNKSVNQHTTIDIDGTTSEYWIKSDNTLSKTNPNGTNS